MTTEKATTMERHIQSGIGALILSILVWSGLTLLDVRDRLTRIETHTINESSRLLRIDTQLNELWVRMRDLELHNARNDKELAK
jgi:hypothetical protein